METSPLARICFALSTFRIISGNTLALTMTGLSSFCGNLVHPQHTSVFKTTTNIPLFAHFVKQFYACQTAEIDYFVYIIMYDLNKIDFLSCYCSAFDLQ